MTETLPADAASFLREPVAYALRTEPGFLLSSGALFALWGAKNAVTGVIKGLNSAYNIGKDERSFIRKNLISIGFTIGLALIVGVAGWFFMLGTGLGEDIAAGIGLDTVWATVST